MEKKNGVPLEKLIIGKAFIVTQMNHWIFFTIGITFMGFAGSGKPDILRFGLLSLLPFLLFLIRRYCNKFLAFAGLHIMAAVLMFVLLKGSMVSTVIFTIYVLGYALASFLLRVHTQDRQESPIMPVVAVAVAGGMLFLQHFQGQKDWDHYYVIALIVFIGLYFVHHYLEHFQRFLMVNDSSTGHIPEQEMFRTGIRLVCLYTVFGVLVLFLSSYIGWLSGLLSPVKDGLLWLVGMFFGLFGTKGEEQEIYSQTEVIRQEEMLPIEPGKTFWLWQVLEKVFLTVIVCLLAAAVVYGVVQLFLFLRERFRHRLRKKEEELEQGIDVREKVDIIRRSSGKRDFFAFLSPKERIRRIYKKRVLEGKSLLVGEGEFRLLNGYTARECGKRLEAEMLASVYEKARYSGEECTAEDVKAAKNKS